MTLAIFHLRNWPSLDLFRGSAFRPFFINTRNYSVEFAKDEINQINCNHIGVSYDSKPLIFFQGFPQALFPVIPSAKQVPSFYSCIFWGSLKNTVK